MSLLFLLKTLCCKQNLNTVKQVIMMLQKQHFLQTKLLIVTEIRLYQKIQKILMLKAVFFLSSRYVEGYVNFHFPIFKVLQK